MLFKLVDKLLDLIVFGACLMLIVFGLIYIGL